MSIQHQFTARAIEALIRTAAELWAVTGDPHKILSGYQSALLARVQELVTDEDPEHGEHPGVPAPSGEPETAFVIAHHNPVPFAIDEPAFARWLTADPDRVEGLLPGEHDTQPATDLVALFDAAREARVLTQDPRLELCLDPNDPPGLPGFTLLLRNQHDDQDALGLTTGFSRLLFPDTGTSTTEAARFHLEHILEVANGVLYLLTGRL